LYISSLKTTRNWWQHITQLSGAVDANINYDRFVNLTRNGEQINNEVLTDVMNEFFVSVASDYSPLELKFLPNLLGKFDHVSDNLIISEFSVYYELKQLNVNQSSCDDELSNRLLAEVLAAPTCATVNLSLICTIFNDNFDHLTDINQFGAMSNHLF
jgi:hypothetical protein